MERNGQLHAEKQPAATIKFEIGWASKLVWTFCEEIKIIWPHRELNCDFFAVQLAAQSLYNSLSQPILD
jgi:hypothetical protein